MSEPTAKKFDCVESMRRARDEISSEIAEMTYEQLIAWLRGYRYTDPNLQRLAEDAARRSEPVDRPSTGR